MAYRGLDPPAALADRLVCGWIREVDGQSVGRVLPDGCVDVVWRDAGEIAERVAEASDRVAALEREVGRRLRPAGDPLVAEAVGGLAQGAGVGALSRELGVSERRLQRRFRV